MLQSWSSAPSDPDCFRCELVSFGEGLPTTAVNIFETARNRWENREISRSDDCTMNSFGA